MSETERGSTSIARPFTASARTLSQETIVGTESGLKSQPRRVADENYTGPRLSDLGVGLLVCVHGSAVVKLGVAHWADVVTQNNVRGLQPGATDIKWIQKEPLELYRF